MQIRDRKTEKEVATMRFDAHVKIVVKLQWQPETIQAPIHRMHTFKVIANAGLGSLLWQRLDPALDVFL